MGKYFYGFLVIALQLLLMNNRGLKPNCEIEKKVRELLLISGK